MPEIPSAAEAGFPQLVAENSYALFAPAGTPARILMQLHDATVAALALPEVRDRLHEQGAEVVSWLDRTTSSGGPHLLRWARYA